MIPASIATPHHVTGRWSVITVILIALTVPVAVFSFAHFEVSLTLLLAPLAALCLTRATASLRNLFLVCVGAGLISVGLASLVLRDQFSSRYFFHWR